MIVLTRDWAKLLAGQLQRSCGETVTYPETGRTATPTLPGGYQHDRLSLHVGDGEAAWRRARDAIGLWRAHAHAGVTITPSDAPIREGTTVLASRGVGPALIVAPCRIVYRTDEPTRFGFAYGSLPGHPERGEEAFHVVLREDGSVSAELVAFSRPADFPTRAAAPVARQIQKIVARRYLEGIQKYVTGGG